MIRVEVLARGKWAGDKKAPVAGGLLLFPILVLP
jgi:hypothetical protein